MTLHRITKEEHEHYWAKRTIDAYKGKMELAYRCGSIPIRKLRIMADENEEAAELLRKINAGLVTIDLHEEEDKEELDEREEQIAWDEILYWDDNRKHH